MGPSSVLTGVGLLLLCAASVPVAARPIFRKPPPERVVELVGHGMWSVVELRDGTLLANTGARSADGGQTRTEGSFTEGVSGDQLLRLQSGALALAGNGKVWLSPDEGQMWGANGTPAGQPPALCPGPAQQWTPLVAQPGVLWQHVAP